MRPAVGSNPLPLIDNSVPPMILPSVGVILDTTARLSIKFGAPASNIAKPCVPWRIFKSCFPATTGPTRQDAANCDEDVTIHGVFPIFISKSEAPLGRPEPYIRIIFSSPTITEGITESIRAVFASE